MNEMIIQTAIWLTAGGTLFFFLRRRRKSKMSR